MNEDYLGYGVSENTGDSTDPSIDDVVELTLERAKAPRDDHSMSHLDEYISKAVERFGEELVEECVRLHIYEGLPQRSAGATVFGSEEYVWGIDVGVAASAYVRELRAR